ncbi:MAG: hypothetical protein GX257_10430 [Clostridiales bacterium]|nr:hypothetical protein [Clostridiales bacterium]
MKVEVMLYVYLAISAAMIVFNIVSAFVFKFNDRKLDKKSTSFNSILGVQMKRLKNELQIEKKHIRFLVKRLRNVGDFLAFDKALTEIYDRDSSTVQKYFQEIYPALLSLAKYYKGRSPVKSAFFPYIISKYKILAVDGFDAIMRIMMEYLHKQDFFCRRNALLAIFSSEDIDSISDALHTVDNLKVRYNTKLISEGILRHTANRNAICKRLLAELGDFTVDMQVSIINLCRLSSAEFSEEILGLLLDDRHDNELRFACIRYFATHPNPNAHKVLLRFNDARTAESWEYIAVSSTALSEYPSEDTIESLKKNLYSSNWHVRHNSADSLEKLGLHYSDLIEVFEGDDRYAREIMQYHLDARELLALEGGAKE